ncbi:hypothetical protein, partial [Bartonella sp. AA89HNZF]|uniref:hypothetical protein n=1 Tax=Bartonella sp. AA89HNZF TaxID=3243442 RepID=UPI0035CECF25
MELLLPPSVPVSPSSLDTVSPPSASAELKPSGDSAPINPSSNLQIRAVVPQVPTYLLLPNALFHAGLVD